LMPSTIEGVGLFAAEFIPKGAVIWRFGKNLDQSIPIKVLEELPEAAKAQIFHYAYLNKKSGEYVLCFDDARFFNHSETA
ncbi:MAG: SET domain-containing protein, partial [Minisyncoccia bacterium]